MQCRVCEPVKIMPTCMHKATFGMLMINDLFAQVCKCSRQCNICKYDLRHEFKYLTLALECPNANSFVVVVVLTAAAEELENYIVLHPKCLLKMLTMIYNVYQKKQKRKKITNIVSDKKVKTVKPP